MAQIKVHTDEAAIELLRQYMQEKVADYGNKTCVQVLTDVLERLRKQDSQIKILSRLV